VDKRPIHQCECSECQQARSNPTKVLHQQMNFFLSTLDEHQRRLYVGLESQKLGHGGDRQLTVITGLSVDTIAQGRHDLEQAEPTDRIRTSGGGRWPVEKKTRRS
jgi:hypothetical protein